MERIRGCFQHVLRRERTGYLHESMIGSPFFASTWGSTSPATALRICAQRSSVVHPPRTSHISPLTTGACGAEVCRDLCHRQPILLSRLLDKRLMEVRC